MDGVCAACEPAGTTGPTGGSWRIRWTRYGDEQVGASGGSHGIGADGGDGSAERGSASPGIPYTFHEREQETFVDTGLCDPGLATITLDAREVLHVNATQAGLTQEQIEAALESDTGLISSATYTETGKFHVVEADGTVFTGHFTAWFGGSNLTGDRKAVVFTGTFSLHGTSDDGRRVAANFVSHVTMVDGEPVTEFRRGEPRGC